MARVGEVTKLIRQILGDLKVGKCYELKLTCEAGVMKVIMSADLGTCVQLPQPQHGEPGYRGHQSPRRRAGPSYLRRQEKRAAARAAAAASSAKVEAVQDKVEEADNAPPAAPTTILASRAALRAARQQPALVLSVASLVGAVWV